MAFTRGFDDKDRINMFLDQDLNMLKYMVNVPGNGTTPYYIVDPQIRLEKFGANISDNMVDINSYLKGINKVLSRDEVKNKKDEAYNNNYVRNNFPSISSAITDQSRAITPAWTLRDLEQNNWCYLHKDPQNFTELMFENNISSRILEKDNYELVKPCKLNGN
tara:strand:+ start:2039 stop:2527 length:489 start_codon:yes stop_codon:yes gene_type:complete